MPDATMAVESTKGDSCYLQEKIEANLVADFMLNDILSNLDDVERTDSGIQAMLSMIAISTPLKRMISSFFKKIKKDRAYLKSCSGFQSRILLFSVVHYAFLGDITDCDLRFMTGKVLPLEAILVRLEDITVIIQSNMKKFSSISAGLYNISLHTVKQHALMLMKKGQYSNADRFVNGKEFIKPHHMLALQNMIKHCIMKQGLLEKILHMKEHSYLGYFVAVGKFIHGLNRLLETSSLQQLGEAYVDKQRYTKSDSCAENASSVSNEVAMDVEDQNQEKHRDDLSLSGQGSDEDKEKEESDEIISPKISLSYRLKNQNSGIIIPCKYIVQHCRDVSNDVDLESRGGLFRMPANRMKRTVNPGNTKYQKASKQTKRRIVLGDRFETATAVQNSPDRSYGYKKKTLFTMEMDSYIAEGCLQLGLGNWTNILKSFPFPAECTNVKIKDRFRILVRKNFIAVLDDGDISVLNKALKAKLATAKSKMVPFRKQNSRFYSENSSRSSVISKADNRMQKISGDITREQYTHQPVSPSVSSEYSVDESLTEAKRFLPIEDAYLVCGAMHLGLRWDAILEYMDFRSHVTVDDMQQRWDVLEKKKAVQVIDDSIQCHDLELRRKCEDIAKDLKNKILSCRRGYSPSHSTNESVISEEPLLIRGRKKRGVIIDTDDSEDDLPDFTSAPTPVKSPCLNKSIDAGTQTNRPRFLLGNRSPGTLEGSSNSDKSDFSEKSSPQISGGSPVRPSTINLFKSRDKKAPHKDKGSPQLLERRQKRQRELERIQRRDKTVQKRQWTENETSTFLTLLKTHEPGRWSKILDEGYDILKDRTPVMLKDKFRNLLQKGLVPPDIVKKWDARRSAANSYKKTN